MLILKRVMGFIVLIIMIMITSSAGYTFDGYTDIQLPNGETVKVIREDFNNGYRYEVEFPNGKTYYWEQTGNIGAGGGSPRLTPQEMFDADKAIEYYEQQYGEARAQDESSSGKKIFGFLFVLCGLFGAISPRTAWYLEIGWQLRDAEPTELALILNRIIGIAFCIVGLVILF
jgi:hypothetical protein